MWVYVFHLNEILRILSSLPFFIFFLTEVTFSPWISRKLFSIKWHSQWWCFSYESTKTFTDTWFSLLQWGNRVDHQVLKKHFFRLFVLCLWNLNFTQNQSPVFCICWPPWTVTGWECCSRSYMSTTIFLWYIEHFVHTASPDPEVLHFPSPPFHCWQSDVICEFQMLAGTTCLFIIGVLEAVLLLSFFFFFFFKHLVPQTQPDGRCLAAEGPRCQILEYSFPALARGFIAGSLACTSASLLASSCLAGSCSSGAMLGSGCYGVGWLHWSELPCRMLFLPWFALTLHYSKTNVSAVLFYSCCL